MRPSALTAVASVMMSPVPPDARAARCAKCQSVGAPISSPSGAALYWHIGAIQTRLGMGSDRGGDGSKSLFITFSPEVVSLGAYYTVFTSKCPRFLVIFRSGKLMESMA